MTVNIINSQCKNRSYDGIVLDETDFHPCYPFFIDHPQIKPETIDRIYIRGILEQHPYVRCVMRYCDYMLKNGGFIEIDFYNIHFDYPGYAVRGYNEWAYELSLVFGDRICLVDKKNEIDGKFIYKKIGNCLPMNDTIERWSFGIVSDGRKNERILQLIHQISLFQIPEFEILICGPSPSDTLPVYVKVIDDNLCYTDKRIPISKKKNLIIKRAQYNNLIIMHDRMSFPANWYKKMCLYGNYYDLLCTPIVNEEKHSNRMIDWTIYTYTSFIQNKIERFIPHRTSLFYNEWSKNIYINGGFFQVKRHFVLEEPLNPNLYWGEKEDTDFSIRLYNSGVLFEMFTGNTIYSQGIRFQGGEIKKMSLVMKLRYFWGAYRRYKKELLNYKKYLAQ